MTAVDRQPAPQPPRELDQVDDEIVDCEQQESDAREQRKLGRKAAEQTSNGHEATGSSEPKI